MDRSLKEAFKAAIFSYFVKENEIDVYRDLCEAGVSAAVLKIVQENIDFMKESAARLWVIIDKQIELDLENFDGFENW